MFEWLSKLGKEANTLGPIIESFKLMMVDGRHMFDLASNALLGGTDVEAIREDLFQTDRKINKAEQKIRRDLIVHASVHGSAEFPSCLVLMSIAKDAERIGDYCKNVFDLAAQRRLDPNGPMGSKIKPVKDRVSALLAQMISVYAAQNDEQAKAHLREAKEIENICDRRIDEILDLADETTARAVVAALTYRYFKRIVAHSKNIITSIVMPLDKLDFFDER
ncbi:MAG: hypothetical protein H6807_04725 [Planctomycetes bacterium]|nr:hypothetical protein [Planctomycetota bacterium]